MLENLRCFHTQFKLQ
jgi:calcium-dependent protein kinase